MNEEVEEVGVPAKAQRREVVDLELGPLASLIFRLRGNEYSETGRKLDRVVIMVPAGEGFPYPSESFTMFSVEILVVEEDKIVVSPNLHVLECLHEIKNAFEAGSEVRGSLRKKGFGL